MRNLVSSIFQVPPLYSAFAKCKSKVKQLLAPATAKDFADIYSKYGSQINMLVCAWICIFLFFNILGNYNILWDEVIFKPDGGLYWCSTSVKVPIEVMSGDLTKPFFLVSLAGSKPNLHALPLDSDVETEAFCQLRDNVFNTLCRK